MVFLPRGDGTMGPVETREDASTIAVTGIGSMPGTDSAEAARIVAGELDIPHLVELPARGPGGDMLGRTLALVSSATGEFAAETTPDGWRLAGGRSGGDLGRQMRRGVSWLAEDVDRMELELAGFTGRVKVQVTGPWTLAAGVEAVRGTRLVADAGACSDLAAALAEALAEHVAMIGRRIPGAQVVVQVDEPALPIVLAGHIRTPSGRGVLRVPEVPELVSGLAAGGRRRTRVQAPFSRWRTAATGTCPSTCCAALDSRPWRSIPNSSGNRPTRRWARGGTPGEWSSWAPFRRSTIRA